jgi:hypothetical protein
LDAGQAGKLCQFVGDAPAGRGGLGHLRLESRESDLPKWRLRLQVGRESSHSRLSSLKGESGIGHNLGPQDPVRVDDDARGRTSTGTATATRRAATCTARTTLLSTATLLSATTLLSTTTLLRVDEAALHGEHQLERNYE